MSVVLRSNTLTPGKPGKNAVVYLKLRSGRERAQIKRWWNSGGNTKNYIDCSAAVIEGRDGCKYTLVWPHNYDSRLDLEWVAHSGTIHFTMFRRVDHVALLCMDGTVLMHWVFNKMPGVKPKVFYVNDSCPDGCTPGGGSGGGGGICHDDNDCPPGYHCQGGICVPDDPYHCWTIPELPTIDTAEPKAPLSTSLFTICTDIPGLPPLN